MDATTTEAVGLLRKLRRKTLKRRGAVRIWALLARSHRAASLANLRLNIAGYYVPRLRRKARLAAIDRAIATLGAQP